MPNKKERLKNWFQEVIETYRSKTGDLSKVIKGKIRKEEQYHTPCQIEVFWIGEPVEWQILVKTHDEDREDKQIIVNGPFEGHEFIEKVKGIMEENRWQRTSEDSFKVEGEKRLSEIFAYHLRDYVNQHIKRCVFTNPDTYNRSAKIGAAFPKNGWTSLIRGNIANNPPNEFVEDIVERAKDKIESKSPSVDQRGGNQKNEKTKTTNKNGVGSYIYPLTWVGSEPKQSFEEIVFDYSTQGINKIIILNQDFDGKELIITRGGFIGIIDAAIKSASNILNTIFGTAFLFRFFCIPVQKSEVIHFETDLKEKKVGSMSRKLSSWREYLTVQLPDNEFPTRREVPKEELKMVIEKAESIYKKEKYEFLIPLIHSAMHLRNYEYTPSFLLSWILTEQTLNQLINNRLKNQFDVNHDRRDKIRNSPNWGMSQKIELSEITGIIDGDSREFLQEKRSIRNDIVHKMERADKKKCEELFDFTFNLVEVYMEDKDEYDSLKSKFPFEGIEYRPSKEII